MLRSLLCHNFVLRLITSLPPSLYNSRSNGKSSRSASGTSHLNSSWCAIIIAVMSISSSNTIVGSRHWSEHARPTDRENGGRVERITVRYASASDVAGMLIDLETTASKVVDGLTGMSIYCLTWSSWNPLPTLYSLVFRLFTKLPPFLFQHL